MARILFLMMFPFVCFSQITPREDIPVNNLLKEKENLDTKRKASYNLDEIKVRWKKAALENCPGAPCSAITAPGAPTGVVATVGNSVSVSFVAPTNNGGRAITGYTVTSNPATSPVTGTTSPIIVTGLTNGTSYTFTVVATNAIGNSVASSASTAVTAFTCGTGTISDIDNNPYNTVLIGTQCWTKENLKVTKYNDGTVIGDSTNSTWGTAMIGARTENQENLIPPVSISGYVGTFGYLYNWYAATDPRKLCPDGWRVPSDSDWNKLVISLHSGSTPADTSSTSYTQSTTAGTALKSNVTNLSPGSGLGWDPATSSSPGTNTIGFSALPGGLRDKSLGLIFPGFDLFRNEAHFWSATESKSIVGTVVVRKLRYNSGVVLRVDVDKFLGLSIRCLKD